MQQLIRSLALVLIAGLAIGCTADGGLGGISNGGNNQDSGTLVDEDGDGVRNNRDLCPDTAEDTAVDDSGCAEGETPSAPDADGDGVVDSYDQCSGTAEGASVNDAGCASGQTVDTPDADGDGVVDDSDLCPNTQNGDAVDSDGCSATQEPANTPLIVDLGVLAGTVSEIADFQCSNFPNGVGEEVTFGLACDLGGTLGVPLCRTTNPEAAVDGVGDGSTSAIVELVTSLLVLPPLPTGDLTANAGVAASSFGTISEGNVAGFFVEFPTDAVDVNVLQSMTVTTFLNDTEQETRDLLQPLGAGLGGTQLVGGAPVLVGFENTLPYDQVSIVFGGTVEAEPLSLTDPTADPSALLGEVGKVYGACTAATPPAAP